MSQTPEQHAAMIRGLRRSLLIQEAVASVRIDEGDVHTCSDYCQRPACVERRAAAGVVGEATSIKEDT